MVTTGAVPDESLLPFASPSSRAPIPLRRRPQRRPKENGTSDLLAPLRSRPHPLPLPPESYLSSGSCVVEENRPAAQGHLVLAPSWFLHRPARPEQRMARIRGRPCAFDGPVAQETAHALAGPLERFRFGPASPMPQSGSSASSTCLLPGPRAKVPRRAPWRVSSRRSRKGGGDPAVSRDPARELCHPTGTTATAGVEGAPPCRGTERLPVATSS